MAENLPQHADYERALRAAFEAVTAEVVNRPNVASRSRTGLVEEVVRVAVRFAAPVLIGMGRDLEAANENLTDLENLLPEYNVPGDCDVCDGWHADGDCPAHSDGDDA